ncbi:hypothetical protein [Nocardia sp. NPDC051570]|uniref:hypothetical protein n=1 Tax=Nocardia sp. NPDC051570 TaxID=3364324 RepID=UPI0037B1316C
MRCLLIAPASVDVQVLSDVLAEQGNEVLSSAELGAGVTLADAAIDRADCAVAVLPSGSARSAEGLAAVFIEIGIVVGRGLPTLVIVEPPDAPPAALAGVTIVRTPLDHIDALRLHLRMFTLSAVSGSARRRTAAPAVLEPSTIAEFRTRLDAIRNPAYDERSTGRGVEHSRWYRLERLIFDILSTAGAVLWTGVKLSTSPPSEADAVAYVPGTESVLGAIIVEVKLRRLTETDLQLTREQLQAQMIAGRASFGLLVYDSLISGAHEVSVPYFMLVLSVDGLLAELEHLPLAELLLRARNRSVHGALT